MRRLNSATACAIMLALTLPTAAVSAPVVSTGDTVSVAGASTTAPASRRPKARHNLKIVIKAPKGVPANVRLVGRTRQVLTKPATRSKLVAKVKVKPGRYQVVADPSVGHYNNYSAKKPVTRIKVRRKGVRTVRVKLRLDKSIPEVVVKKNAAGALALAWKGPRGTYKLRRADGPVPPATRTSGMRIPLPRSGSTVVDMEVAGGREYSYSLFVRTRAGWSDPGTVTVGVMAADGSFHELLPDTLIVREGDGVVVTPASTLAARGAVPAPAAMEGSMTALLPPGRPMPRVGSGALLGPGPGRPFGMVGVVVAVGPGPRAVTIVNGAIPDAIRSMHARINWADAADRQEQPDGDVAADGPMKCGHTGTASFGLSAEQRGHLEITVPKKWKIPTGVHVDMRYAPRVSALTGVTASGGAFCRLETPAIPISAWAGPVPVAATLSGDVTIKVTGSTTVPNQTSSVDLGVAFTKGWGSVDAPFVGDLVNEEVSFDPLAPTKSGDAEISVNASVLAGIGQAGGAMGAVAGVEGTLTPARIAISIDDSRPALCFAWNVSSDASASLTASAWAGPFEKELTYEFARYTNVWNGYPRFVPNGCEEGGPTPTATPTTPGPTPTTPSPTDPPTPDVPCAPGNPAGWSTYVGVSASVECLAGHELETRRGLNDYASGMLPCLLGITTPGQKYTARNSCGVGAAGLAQARLVNKINTDASVRSRLGLDGLVAGDPTGKAVDAALQWNTELPVESMDPLEPGTSRETYEADLMAYDRSRKDGKLWVAEVANARSKSIARAYDARVDEAVAWWDRRLGGGRAERLDVTGYEDTFKACGTDFVVAPEDLAGGKLSDHAGGTNALLVVQATGEGAAAQQRQRTAGTEDPLVCPELYPWEEYDPSLDPRYECVLDVYGLDAFHDLVEAVREAREGDSAALSSILDELFTRPGARFSDCPQAAGIRGDPHINTIDGLAYDIQSVGEFHMLTVPELDLEVQARFVGMSGGSVSVLDRTAVDLNGFRIEVDRAGRLHVNGDVLELNDGESAYLNNGALVSLRDGTHLLMTPRVNGKGAVIMLGFSSISAVVPEGVAATGLLGDNDGDPLNDLKAKDGIEPAAVTDTAFIHGHYANSWRISQEESLFTYRSGESTETFTDLSYPRKILTRADFSAPQISVATAKCANVPEGSARDGCVFDFLVTGDERFVDDAEDGFSAPWSAIPGELDESGSLVVDFDSTVPANFQVNRTSVRGLGAVAGPLAAGQGLFYDVAVSANSSAVRATTDYVVLGTLSTREPRSVDAVLEDRRSILKFSPAGATATSGSVVEVERGTLPSGRPWVKYRHVVEVPLASASLSGGHQVTNFSSDPDEQLVVSRLQFDLVDPTPATVGTLQVGQTVWPADDGAAPNPNGVLATPDERERWRFTVTPDTGPIGLTFVTAPGLSNVCRGSVLVRLETREQVSPCFDPQEMEPGEYELRVAARWVQGGERYALQLHAPAGPDEIQAQVGQAPVTFEPNLVDGAGVLAAPGAHDVYELDLVRSGILEVDIECIEPVAGCVPGYGLDPDVEGFSGNVSSFPVEAGQHTLTLYAGGGRRSYRMTLRVVDPAPRDYAVGDYIHPTREGAGLLTRDDTVHRYRFTVLEEERYFLEMPAHLRSHKLGDRCRGWRLRAEGGEFLDPCLSRWNGQVLGPGTYTLTVMAFGLDDLPYEYGFVIYPESQVRDQTFDTDDASRSVLDQGGTLTHSTDRASGRGWLENGQSTDTYRFRTSGPGWPDVAIECESDGGLYGNRCAEWDLQIVGAASHMASTGATYELLVSAASSHPGDYQVRIGLAAEPRAYELGETVAWDGDGDAFGSYRFTVTAAGTYVSSSAGDPGVSVLTTDGEMVLPSAPGRWELDAGDHYLSVGPYTWGVDLGIQEHYTLSLARATGPVEDRTMTSSPSVTWSGSGRLADGQALHRYDIEVDQTGDYRFAVTGGAVATFERADGDWVEQEDTHLRLHPGTHVVWVRARDQFAAAAVDYQLRVGRTEVLDVIDVDLDQEVVADEATGAGFFATRGEVDAYRFTVPAEGAEVVASVGGVDHSCWSLSLWHDGEMLQWPCSDAGRADLAAGTYVLFVGESGSGAPLPATYSLTLATTSTQSAGDPVRVRPDQLATPITISGTIPAAGVAVVHALTVADVDAELASQLVVERRSGCVEAWLHAPLAQQSQHRSCSSLVGTAGAGQHHLEVMGQPGARYEFLAYLTDVVDPRVWE